MGFLNSWPLWGELAVAGIAVPIIIHLLYSKHRQQTDWAVRKLLRHALVRFEDHLIWFLVLLVAASLLRPTLSSDSAEWPGEKRRGLVVAVDASLSMNHGEPSRFHKAIARARHILGSARKGDPVSLVLMSKRPKILIRRKGYDEATCDAVLEAQKDPTPYTLSLEQNLEQLDELVSEFTTPGSECYLITDAQQSDWAALSEKSKETFGLLTRKVTSPDSFASSSGHHGLPKNR